MSNDGLTTEAVPRISCTDTSAAAERWLENVNLSAIANPATDANKGIFR